jgi:Holliday junction DNA helicase RuvA
MIGKLSGKIDSFLDDHLIIDVGGVGYLVFCSGKTRHKLQLGEFCQLFIETHVREDHINLYGFLSLIEKQVFNLLLAVNGIGPRMAINILSSLSPEEIELAIGNRDKELFKSISGVGQKLAERIIIELKDKVSIYPKGSTDITNLISGKSSDAADAISALINLGINRIEAQNSINAILVKMPDASIDELIKLSLKTRG